MDHNEDANYEATQNDGTDHQSYDQTHDNIDQTHQQHQQQYFPDPAQPDPAPQPMPTQQQQQQQQQQQPDGFQVNFAYQAGGPQPGPAPKTVNFPPRSPAHNTYQPSPGPQYPVHQPSPGHQYQPQNLAHQPSPGHQYQPQNPAHQPSPGHQYPPNMNGSAQYQPNGPQYTNGTQSTAGYYSSGPAPVKFPPTNNGNNGQQPGFGNGTGYQGNGNGQMPGFQGNGNGPMPGYQSNGNGQMPGFQNNGNGQMPGYHVNNNGLSQPSSGIPINMNMNSGMTIPQQLNVEGWKTGLFDCMDDPMSTLITAFCPCITFGQVAEILDNGQTSCATSGMLYGLVWFLIAMPCLMSCTYRTKLRNRFGLVESPAPDWVTHFLCDWCAICQEYRELQLRGLDPSIGWQGNVAKVQAGFLQQQQQANMNAPPNQRMMS